MLSELLTQDDLAFLQSRGIPLAEVERQIRLFECPPAPLRLDRPCTVGDGILRLGEAERTACIAAFEAARAAGRVMAFVPASGAASRMFQDLMRWRDTPLPLSPEAAARRAGAGDEREWEAMRFLGSLGRLPFHEELRAELAARGLDLETLARHGDLAAILDALLGAAGMDAASLPKALLPFHRTSGGAVRTAFEEQLVEAAAIASDAWGACRAHFTVSPSHLDRFRSHLEAVRAAHEARLGVRFEVGFSVQDPATDTLAVDLENRPFRDAAGRLLFRPGGHGALLANLSRLRGDLALVKNIDNVASERLLPARVAWRKVLGGCLVRVQRRIHDCLERLASDLPDAAVLDGAMQLGRDLALTVPHVVAAAGPAAVRAYLVRLLDRPLRVAGVVPNTGEPGGGPFWVRGRDGASAIQIVESAQVDGRSEMQRAVFAAATHFNPVDLALGLRDRHGAPYDLRRFADPEAVFLAQKSSNGRSLKALEHPGLWNGGMAHWTTLLVEVPESTFSPVKTLMDFLRPEHQPD
jgi:hypothetical protein